ncbi:MAG TPA: DUF4313 domain-containing protein [Gemmataceae bacterium]|jgi:hypothetical protein
MAEVIDPIVSDLLRDLRALTGRRFVYEDLWCGMVPFDGELTELQTGPPVPFAELTWRERADVLREFIPWDHYAKQGLDSRDQEAMRNNVMDGKPSQKWLEDTSFVDPSLRVQRRQEMIQETFELSREIGYHHFLAENFDRPDPVLVRLGPEERKAFLRQWWDAARERMYESYCEQVAGLSNEELARNREAYRQEVQANQAEGVLHDTSEAALERLDVFGVALEQKALTPAQKELAASFQQASASEADQKHGTGMVHFRGFDCEVEQRAYANGRMALVLVDVRDREDVAVATVNLPEAPLKAGEVFIKDYSENEGMLAALEKAGIVKATGETVRSGFVEMPVATVLSPIHRRGRQDDLTNSRTNESGASSGESAKDVYQDILRAAASRSGGQDRDMER